MGTSARLRPRLNQRLRPTTVWSGRSLPTQCSTVLQWPPATSTSAPRWPPTASTNCTSARLSQRLTTTAATTAAPILATTDMVDTATDIPATDTGLTTTDTTERLNATSCSTDSCTSSEESFGLRLFQ